MNIGKTGKSGEDRVAAFLQKQGFIIVKRNYISRYGEIDIIAENKQNILFVEVKTRRENSIVSGVQAVDGSKCCKITLTAQDFLTKFHTRLQPRFDVAEVIVYKRPDGSDGYKLNYIENAF